MIHILLQQIRELKKRLQATEGIPLDQAHLIYGGRQLQDGLTLAKYGIRDDATVHCVLRMRGGMYDESSAQSDLPKSFVAVSSEGEIPITWTYESYREVVAKAHERFDDDDDDDDERRSDEDDEAYIARLRGIIKASRPPRKKARRE